MVLEGNGEDKRPEKLINEQVLEPIDEQRSLKNNILGWIGEIEDIDS